MSGTNHERVLINNMHSLLESGKYSDMTITCRGREFHVHRNVLCTASRFFAAACDSNFLEAQEARIDLSADDPDTLQRMLSYLYATSYDDEDHDDRDGARHSDAWIGSANNSQNAISNRSTYQTSSRTLAPREQETNRKGDNTSAKVRGSTLLNNVLVYALAEKYDIQSLKDLAKCKLSAHALRQWDEEDLLSVLEMVYETTPATDRGLRDVISAVCSQHMAELVTNPRFRDIICKDSMLAFEITIRTHEANESLDAQNAYFKMRLEDLEREKTERAQSREQDSITRAEFLQEQLRREMELAREEKRLLIECLARHCTCRHCSRRLDLIVVRAGGVGTADNPKDIRMRCRHCSTRY